MSDFLSSHLDMKKQKARIYLIARPFLGHTSGTGEQYVSNVIYASFSKSVKVEKLSDIKIIPPYHSWMSIIYYDFFATFIVLFSCKIRNIKLAFFASPYQCIFLWFFRLFGIKTTVIIHDCFFIQHGCKSFFDKYSFFLYRLASRYADDIITSTIENQVLIEQYFFRKSYIIPLFLDESFHIDFIPKKFSKTFGYIGKYENARKRVFYLLDFLKKTSEKVHFVFAGHMREAFQQELNTIKNKYITYEILGPIDFSYKIDFYRRIHFLFFPTDLEGFGLPLLEALRTSVIPIVFEDAEIPEILKKSCLQIKNIADIDTILTDFSDNLEKYSMTIYENYVYSQKFNEKNVIEFFQTKIEKSLI